MKRTAIAIAAAACIGAFFSGEAWGQSAIPTTAGTYLGITGDPGQGDLDRFMVAFFEIPDTVSAPIYFAVQSPGMEDTDAINTNRVNGDSRWNLAAQPSYSYHLVGGAGTVSSPSARDRTFASANAAQTGGDLLATIASTTDFPDDAAGWYTFPAVYASQGERIGNKYYFKVIAEAPSGSLAKNGFRLNVGYNSLNGSGSPTEVPGARAFAFTWTVQLISGLSYNLYPFVPDTATGNLIAMNHDMDGTGTLALTDLPNPTPTTRGTDVSGNNASSDRAASSNAVTGETGATWHLAIGSGTPGMADGVNMTEFWFEGDYDGDTAFNAGDEYLRTYSLYYAPNPATTVSVTPSERTTLTGQSTTFTMQLVDAAGDPVSYVRSVYVEVDGSAEISAPANNGTAQTELIATNSDGTATVTITAAAVQTATVAFHWDGTGSSSTVGAGGGATRPVYFLDDPAPTISSVSNTVFIETAGSPQTIANIVVTDTGSANIASANDLRIMLPSELGAVFSNVATVAVTGANVGTYNVSYENANRTAAIEIPGGFATGATTFAGLALASPYSVSNGKLGISWNGAPTAAAFDDKTISIASQYATYVWNGSVSSDWSNANNWSPAAVPNAATVNALIPYLSSGVYPQLSANVDVRNLTVDSGASLTTAGFALTVAGTISAAGSVAGTIALPAALSGTYTTGGGNLSFSAPLTLSGNTRLDAGGGSISFAAAATVDGGYALDIESDGMVSFSSAIGGTTPPTRIQVGGAGSVAVNAGASFSAAGNTIQFDVPVAFNADTTLTETVGSIIFNDTVTLAAGVALTLEAPEVDFNGGAGSVSGTGTSTIAINAYGGAAVQLAEAAQGDGNLELTAADIAAIASGFQSIAIASAGGISWEGTATLNSPTTLAGNFTLSSGTMSLGAALGIAGTTTISGGTLNDGGYTITTSGSAVTLEAGATLTLTGSWAFGASADLTSSGKALNDASVGNGFTVTLQDTAAFAGDVAGLGTLNANGQALSVGGDWTIASVSNMTGTLTFDGSTAQAFSPASTVFTAITINNSGPAVITADANVAMSGALTLSSGTLSISTGSLQAGSISFGGGYVEANTTALDLRTDSLTYASGGITRTGAALTISQLSNGTAMSVNGAAALNLTTLFLDNISGTTQLTIGRGDATADTTITAGHTFGYPVVFAANTGNGNRVTVNAAVATATTGAYGITFDAPAILSANLSTDGGAITFNQNVTIGAASVTIDTDTADDEAAGDIVFAAGSVLSASAASYDLTLDARGATRGNVALRTADASAGAAIDDLVVYAANATFNNGIATTNNQSYDLFADPNTAQVLSGNALTVLITNAVPAAITLTGSNQFSSIDLRTTTDGTTAADAAIQYTDSNGIDIARILTGTASGSATVTAGGAVTNSGAITTNTFRVVSDGGADLTFGHTITSFTAANTTSGAIALTNGTALTIGAAGVIQYSGGTVTLANTGAVTVTGNVGAGTGTAAIDTGAAGTITGAGTITAATINLQTTAGTGQIGTSSAAPLYTSGTTTLNIGNSSVTGAYVSHTGALTLGTLNIATNNPFYAVATGALDPGSSALSLGTGSIYLSSGTSLTITGTGTLTTTTGQIDLLANGGALAINAAITNNGTSGSIVNLTGTAGITQSAAIAAGTLRVPSSGGAVVLDNAGNAFTTIGTISSAGQNVTLDHTAAATAYGAELITASGLRLLGTGSFALTNANVVTTLAGSVTGAVSFTSAGGVSIGTVTTVGLSSAATISLTASGGTITQTAGAVLSAGTLNLAATGLITLGEANMVTNLGTVSRGGAFTFNNSGALTVAGTVTGGTTTNDVSITSSGLLTVNAAISATAPGTVGLTGAGVTVGAAVTGASGVTISAGTGTFTHSSGAIDGTDAQILISADKMILSGGTIGSAATDIVVLRNYTAAHAVDIGSTNDIAANTLELSAAELNTVTGTLTIGDAANTGAVTVSAATALTVPGIVTILNGSSDIAVNAALSKSSGALTLNSAAAITDNGSGSLASTGLLTLSAVSGIGVIATNPINVGTVGGLSATNSATSGDIYIRSTPAAAITLGGAGYSIANNFATGSIRVDANGSITLAGTMSAGGTITLNPAGTLTGAGFALSAPTVQLGLNGNATGIGASGAAIDVDASALAASSTGAAQGIYINSTGTGALVVGSSGAGLTTTGGNAPIALTAAGSVTVNQAISADGTGAATLSASAAGTTLTTSAAVGATINGTVSLRFDKIALGAAVSVGATGTADAYLYPYTSGTSTNIGGAAGDAGFDLNDAELDYIAAGTIHVGEDSALTAYSGSMVIGASEAVTLGAKNIKLSSAADIQGGANALTCGTLTLSAASGIGNTTPISGTATTIAFANSTSNAVSISNAGSVTVSGTNSSSGSAISVAASSGTLTVGALNIAATGTGAVNLTADDMTVTGTVTAGLSGANLTTYTAGTDIFLGGSGSGLSLSDAELDLILTAGTLTIGGASHTGGITINNDVALSGPTGPVVLGTDGGTITVSNAFATAANGTADLTLDARTGALNTGVVTGAGQLTAGNGGAAALIVDAGAGINLSNAGNLAATVTLTNNGNGAASNIAYVNNRAVSLSAANSAADGTLSITNNTGLLTLTNATTTGAGAANIAITAAAGGLSLTGPVTAAGTGYVSITSAGAVSQGAAAGVVTASTGGLELIGTGPFNLNTYANPVAIVAADTNGSVALLASAAFTVGTVHVTSGIDTTGGTGGAVTLQASAGSITLAQDILTNGGNVSIERPVLLSGLTRTVDTDLADAGATNAGSVTFTGTIDNASALVVDATADGTGTSAAVDFQGVIGAAPLSAITASGLSVRFGGNATTSGNQTATATTVYTNGTHDSTGSNGDINFGSSTTTTLTLQANTRLQSGSGAISLGNVTDGASSFTLTLGDAGATQTGAATIYGATTVNSLATVGSAYNIFLNYAAGGQSSTVDTNTIFSNTGSLQIGNAAGDSFTFTAGVQKTTTGTKTLAGTISTTASPINFGTAGNVVLAAATILNPTSGQIDLYSMTSAANVGLEIQGSGTANLGAGNTLDFLLGTGALVLSSKTSGTVTVNGATVTMGSITPPAAAQSFTLSLLGNSTTVTAAATLTNAGILVLGDADTDSFSFPAGLTKIGTYQARLRGTIGTSSSALDLTTSGGVALYGATTLSTGAGTVQLAAVTCDIAAGHDLNLTASGTATATIASADLGTGGALDLTNRTSTGTLTLSGSLTALDLIAPSAATAFNLVLNGGSTTNNVDLTNQTGTLTINAGGFAFNGGATKTSGNITLAGGSVLTDGANALDFGAGTVSVTGSTTVGGNAAGDTATITMAAVTISAGQTLSLGSGAENCAYSVTGAVNGGGSLTVNTAGVSGSVTFGNTVGFTTALAALSVTNSHGVDFQNSVQAGTVTLSDTTAGQTIRFQGNLTASTALTTGAQDFDLSFNAGAGAQTTSITGNTDLQITAAGTITFGNDSGDVFSVSGTLTSSGTATRHLIGKIRTSGQTITFGAVTLDGETTIDSTNNGGTAAGAAVSLGAVTGGANTLVVNAGTGGGFTQSAGTITAQYLRILNGGAIGTAGTPISIDVDYFEARAGGGLLNVSNAGAVTLGFATGDFDIAGLSTAAGGNLTMTATGSITSTEAISANGAGQVAITANAASATFSSNAGATVASGSGSVTITADQIDLGANVSSAGALTIQPLTAATTVSIGAAGGTFALDDTEIGYLQNGFSSITIGRSTSGAATITTAAFLDPVAILGGDTITIAAGSPSLSTSQDNAGITVTATGAGIVVNGGISANGSGIIDINSGAAFTLADGIAIASGTGAITIDTTGANDMTINGDVSTTGAGTITATASRHLIMDATSSFSTANGAIILDADAAASGSLTLDQVTSSGGAQITIRAGISGSIAEADDTAIVSTGGLLFINDAAQGSSIGGAGAAALNTNVGTLRIAAAGNVYINEADAITIGDGTAGVTTSAGLVDIAAGGTVTVANPVTTTGTGTTISIQGTSIALSAGIAAVSPNTITLTATSGAVTRTAGVVATTGGVLALAAGTYIGVDAGADGVVDATWIATSVGTLRATASGGGIFISEANGVVLADGSGNISANGGNIAIATTGAGDVTTGGGTISATGGSVAISVAAGALTTSDAVSATNGTVAMTSTGALTTNAPVATITSGNISLTSSAGAVSLNNTVDSVGTLSASASTLLTLAGTIAAGTTASFTGTGGGIAATGAVNGGTGLAAFNQAVSHSAGSITSGAGGIRFIGNYAASGAASLVGASGVDIDFRGATVTFIGFTHNSNRIVFTQNLAQTFNSNGQTLYHVAVNKSGGSVTLSAANVAQAAGGALTFASTAAATLALNALSWTLGANLSIADGFSTLAVGIGQLVGGAYDIAVGTAAGAGTATIGNVPASLATTGSFSVGGGANAGTVSLGTGSFSVGALSVAVGAFTQTGASAAHSAASISVSGGSLVWDSANAGGTLTVAGGISATAGTLDFGNKTVSAATLSVTGSAALALDSAQITLNGAAGANTINTAGAITDTASLITMTGANSSLGLDNNERIGDLTIDAPGIAISDNGAAADVDVFTVTASGSATIATGTIASNGISSIAGALSASAAANYTSGAALSVIGTGSITMDTGTLTVSAGGMNLTGTGAITSAGTAANAIAVAGNLSWSGGSATATIAITGTGGLFVSGNFTQTATDSGDVSIASGGVSISGQLTNYALLQVASGNLAAAGAGANVNAGTIATLTSGTQSYTGTMSNSGSISGYGLVAFTGAATNTGTINSGTGGILFMNAFSGAGVLNGSTAGVITFQGNTTLGTFIPASSTIAFTGTLTPQLFNSNGQTLPSATISKGALGNVLRIATSDVAQNAGASLAIAAGTLDLATNARTWTLENALAVGDDAMAAVGAGTLNGTQAVAIAGTGLITHGAGTIEQASLTVSGSGTYTGTGTGTLSLSGALAMSAGNLTLGAKTVTAGTMNVTGGTLALDSAQITLTGASGANTINTAGAITDTASLITMTGANASLALDSDASVGNLIVSADTTLISGGIVKNLTIDAGRYLDLDATSNSIALLIEAGSSATANGTLRVLNSAAPNTVVFASRTNGAPIVFSGTDIDYNGKAITLRDIDAAGIDTDIESGAALTIENSVAFRDIVLGGTLNMTGGSTLSAAAIATAIGSAINNGDGANTIAASGDAAILGAFSFTTAAEPTLVMTGAGTTLAATPQIGDLTVGAAASVTLGSALSLADDLTILSGGRLDVSASNWKITIAGDTWNNQTASGGFVPRAGEVEFTAPGGTVSVYGNNDWYDFTCSVAGLVFAFENNRTQQFQAGGTFSLTGGSTNYIVLTRTTGIDGADIDWIPPTPPSAALMWQIDMIPTSNLDLSYVLVKYSDARAHPVVKPDNVDLFTVTTHNPGIGEIGKTCFKWLNGLEAIYSYVEDSDGNGKIDRIKIRASAAINGDFSGFSIAVTGYDIDTGKGAQGYSLGSGSLHFYAHVAEKTYLDSDATPAWRVTANTTLKDNANNKYLLAAIEEIMTPIDTAPPVPAYALSLPGRAETYIRFSEPVYESGGAVVPAASFSAASSIGSRLASSGNGTTEFLLNLGSAPTAAALAAGTTMTLSATIDDAASAAPIDYETDPSYLGLGYPAPEYPTAYGDYTSYAEVGDGGLAPPNRLRTADQTRRLADVLVSVPPAGAADATYFVWPIWARDSVTTEIPQATYETLTGSDAASQTIGLVRDFTGTQWLRDQDITLEARVNPALGTPSAARIHFAANVADAYRSDAAKTGSANTSTDLWLPTFSENAYSGLVPIPYGGHSTVAGSNPSGQLWDFALPASDPNVRSVSNLDFFFTLGAANATNPLYAGRLDIAAGGAIPGNWYTLVRPFSFAVHDVTKQRGSVTILNNVINPTVGETTRVSYQLSKAGRTTIQVFTLDGDLVKVLYRGTRAAGDYTAVWDGKNQGGRAVARGIYFIRVVAPDIDEIRKVMVVK